MSLRVFSLCDLCLPTCWSLRDATGLAANVTIQKVDESACYACSCSPNCLCDLRQPTCWSLREVSALTAMLQVKRLDGSPCYACPLSPVVWTIHCCLPTVICLKQPSSQPCQLQALCFMFSASLPTGFNAVVFSHSINSVQGAIVGLSRHLLMQVRGQGQGWMQS